MQFITEPKMKPNQNCAFCNVSIYRNPSSLKQSKSQQYFCSLSCKNLWRGIPKIYAMPKINPLFKAVCNVYSIDIKPEYLTSLCIFNTSTYTSQDKDFIVLAIARVHGKNKLVGKTPQDIAAIQSCFDKIKLSEIEALDNVESDWVKITFKYWAPNDITYEVE